jgi:hypothetical protein
VKLPILRGTMDRRVLVNYRVDRDVLAAVLPPPFRPRTVGGYGVAGICLIRIEGLRAGPLPRLPGLASENAAHRAAVEWDADDGVRQGVYVTRRDTSSMLNALAGGRVFPGAHHRARFQVEDDGARIDLQMHSLDGAVGVRLRARAAPGLPSGSIFPSLAAASEFFEAGSLGYSATRRPGTFDAMELRTQRWAVAPLAVDEAASSWFDDPHVFPPGSAVLDHALVMRALEHAWVPRAPLSAAVPRMTPAAG